LAATPTCVKSVIEEEVMDTYYLEASVDIIAQCRISYLMGPSAGIKLPKLVAHAALCKRFVSKNVHMQMEDSLTGVSAIVDHQSKGIIDAQLASHLACYQQ
tara:strand:+ start:482 stop:784 length:303 start_codon:yes stop_codon:yes gene_type:complete